MTAASGHTPDAPARPSRGTGAPLSLLRRLDLPSRAGLPRDLLAAFTVGAAQVGNTMAYTILAGVPPVHGLYSAMVGTPVGGLVESTQRMVIVPTAALCLAAGAALEALPPAQQVDGLLVLTLMVGAIMLVAGLLRAGSLVRFIENAVMVGFMAGVSVQIVLGQLPALTGYSTASTNNAAKAAQVLMHLDQIDPPTTLVGLATVAFILVMMRTPARLFAMATALVVGTLLVTLLGLSSVRAVADIAPIPGSFPLPHLPSLSLVPSLTLPAISLAIIALVQAAGISATVANADGSHGTISRDFIGQGAANLVGGVFGGTTMGGSVQATVLNVSAGSRSRWSAVFAGLLVTIVVLAAAPLVEQVPLSVTAGILMVAAISMIRPRVIREIWRADRSSAIVMATTFVLVMAIPLQYAVLGGAGLSVIKYVYLSSLDVRVVRITFGLDGRPHETGAPSRVTDGSVTLLDIYGNLYFGASPKIRESLPAVEGSQRAVVVLRLRGRTSLHSATIGLVRDYAEELARGGGRLYLAGVCPELHEQLARTGLIQMLGTDAVLQAIDEVYGSCQAAEQRASEWLGIVTADGADASAGGMPPADSPEGGARRSRGSNEDQVQGLRT